MDYLTSKKFIEDYFDNISAERLGEIKSIVKQYSSVGPTVEEFFGFLEIEPRHTAHNPCKPHRKNFAQKLFSVPSDVENDIQNQPMNDDNLKLIFLIKNAGAQYSQHSIYSCQISNC